MDDAGERSRATRREVLQATAGALAAGAVSESGTAQQTNRLSALIGSDNYGGRVKEPINSEIVNTGSWPMFQRDTGNTGAVLDGVSLTESISVEWQYDSVKDGATMPVVDHNRVYIGFGTNNDETTQGKLLALSRTDSSVVWEQTFERAIRTPAVVDGFVYFGTHSTGGNHHTPRYGNIYKINATTGEQVWRFEPAGGVSTPPTVVDDTVYFGTKGSGSTYLALLNARRHRGGVDNPQCHGV